VVGTRSEGDMSAIFGETLSFGQENGPDVQLVVFGDEHYARYENLDGYTVVYDIDLGLFCYAMLVDGNFVSSGVPQAVPAPFGLPRHLEEDEAVRAEKFLARFRRIIPPSENGPVHDTIRTFGPNQGLLEGRRLSVGTVRGLTILVEFKDVTSTVTQADVDALLNGQNYTANGNFCSAREYYQLVSNGKLDYQNDVVGPFKLSRERAFYVNTLLVKEALDLAVASGVDLTRYDSRGEGIIDAVNFMYAGQTQYLGEIWPHNSSIDLRYGTMRTSLYMLTSMGRNASELTIGTFCHESGHLLCRFPDMYDYGNRDGDGVESAGIGAYCLMGSGNHNDRGRTPSPVCAYLRDLAGWTDTVDLSVSAELEAVHGDYGTAMKFGTTRLNEYFLVENRSRIGLDRGLPSSGLAVYHCDTRGSNELQEGSSTRHYQCALLQADGHLDLEHNINQGDGTDLFGAVPGTALSHNTMPSSRRWDGSESGLVISGIGTPGERIAFRVGSIAPPDTRQTIRAEAKPNLTIPDNLPAGITSTINIADDGTIDGIAASIDITHTYIGDLEVDLIAPSGRTVPLHHRTGAGQDNLVATFDASSLPALAGMVGESLAGTWTLAVRDLEGQDVGRLNRWTLEIQVKAAEQVIHLQAAPALAIPDANPAGVSSSLMVDRSGTVKRLEVAIDITHTYIGDLRVELVSPTGRTAALHNRIGGGADNLVSTFDARPPSPLAAFVNQSAQGAWLLRVSDLAGRDVGTLNSWSLEIELAN
jgi:M6 family metalloprotease-like protein